MRRRCGPRIIQAHGGRLIERHEVAAGSANRASVGFATCWRLGPVCIHRRLSMGGMVGVAAMPVGRMIMAGLLLRRRMRCLVAEQHRGRGQPLEG